MAGKVAEIRPRSATLAADKILKVLPGYLSERDSDTKPGFVDEK